MCDKFGNKLYSKFMKDYTNDEGEELFDTNGKQLDGTYVKLASDKPEEDVYDRNLPKLGNNIF